MQKSILTPERQRLSVLERYDIRNTSPDEVLDRITHLASRLFSAPVALIALADQDHLWFKSNVGCPHQRLPRTGTFCDTVIRNDALLIVGNALQDERFNQHPSVAGEPFLRFYAGAPLRTHDGYVIGTLCVFDYQARARFTPAEEDTLHKLAAMTVDELELRHTGYLLEETAREQEQAEQRTKLLVGRLKAVTAAATGILTANNLEALQEVLRSACATVLPFDYFDMGLYDEAAHALRFLPTMDDGIPLDAEVVPLAGRLSEHVVRERRSLLTSSSSDPRVAGARTIGTGRPTESIIRTPILANDRVLGVLSAQSYTSNAYTPDDVEVLEALSALAASAIQNLQLLAERQSMEEQLKWEQFLLHTLLEHLPDAIYFKDDQSRFLRLSRSAAARLGVDSPAEAIGRTDLDFYAPELAKRWMADEQEIIRSGNPITAHEWLEQHQDGRETWVSTSKMPLRDPQGTIIGTFGITRDITQRKRVEQNLRRQKQRFRSLVRNSSDLITLLDEHGTILFTSPSITRLLGYESYELIGVNTFEQLHPEDRAALQESFMQVVTTGQNAVSTYRFKDASGNWRWLESVVVNLLHDPSVKAVTVNSRDITERKQHEQSLQKLVEQTAACPDGLLPALVRALAEALNMRWAFVGQLVGNEQIETLAVHGAPDFTFPLARSACEHVFEHPSCLYTRDVAQLFPEDQLLQHFGVNAYMAVPLYSRSQQRLGVLVLMHDASLPDELSSFHRWLITAFAHRATDELENLMNLTRFEAAARAARSLRNAVSVQEIYETATREALLHTKARSANLFLYEAETDCFRVAHAEGESRQLSQGMKLPRSKGLGWRIFDTGRSLYVPDLLREPSIVFFSGRATPGAYVGAPITANDGRTLGILSADTAGSPEWQTLTMSDRYYLEALAQSVSSAIARLGALEEVQRESQRFQSLAELSARLELLDEPVDIARVALESLLPLTGFEQGALWVLEGTTLRSTLQLGELANDVGHLYGTRHLEQETGLLGQAVQERRTLWTSDYTGSDQGVQRFKEVGLKSLLLTPLIYNGGVYGALSLTSFETNLSVSPDMINLLEAVAHRVERALERARFRQELLDTREGALRAIGLALEYRDYETKGHTDRVTEFAMRLGERMNVGAEALLDLRFGAYLHDAGKIAISDGILLKPGRLTPDEFELVKKHVLIGEDMLRQLNFLPERVLQVVRHHHERWDGSGYPEGLAGTRIPLLARLFTVVDVYDALTSLRPYKAAWSHEQALEEIVRQKGMQFDPDVVDAFVALFTSDASLARH